MDSFPHAIICFLSEVMAVGVGRDGVEISPPGNLFCNIWRGR